jgi:peptide-methionine (S)-S-oxide reductase
MRRPVVAVLAAFALSACGAEPTAAQKAASAPPAARELRTAVFAGGCFWCTEADFEKVPGVVSAVAGYIGGATADPTYEQVTGGRTGHYEAVKLTYDPAEVSYRALVDRFWRTVDPTDAGGQFCDRGPSYRTAVFAPDPAAKAEAEASRAAAREALGREIVTPVFGPARFWPAEAYHQDYYKKNPLRYRLYREGCGRDARLRALWGAIR